MRWLIRSIISFCIFAYFAWHVISYNPFDINRSSEQGLGFLAQMENWAFDQRMQAMMSSEKDPNVIIVHVDEESLASIGQWPWPRDKMADIVDTLFEYYEIEVLAFDVTFPEPDRSDDLQLLNEFEGIAKASNLEIDFDFEEKRKQLKRDERLAESFKNRKVVLGFVLDDLENKVGSLPAPVVFSEDIGASYEFDSYIGNLPILQAATDYAGNFHPVSVDQDGKIRRVPMLLSYEGQLYESLSAATIRSYVGEKGYLFRPDADGDSISALLLGNLEIPVGDYMTATVPYRNPEGSFKYISAVDVLNKTAAKTDLKSAVILFGTTAAGLRDFRVTPVADNFAGVEIHANLISGVLSGEVLSMPEEHIVLQLLVMLLLAIAMTIYMPKLSIVGGLITTALLAIGLVLLNLFIWKEHGFVVPIAPSIMLLFGLYLLHQIYGSFVESRRKKQITNLFGQYVPPKRVEMMVENPDQYSMETKDEVLTVMFADIVSFTKISEELEAEQVTVMLNLFLTKMTDIVQKTNGTIDKYMGDSIMAFWGAPVVDSRHAEHALEAAFAMQNSLTELNQQFSAKGLPAIEICIGLNTGNMRVGDMGSEFRVAYTVIGDEVNLAARIEGLTRVYGSNIIVGENTRSALADIEFLELDKVLVKGKDNPVVIFEPMLHNHFSPQDAENMLKLNKEAQLAYREQDWGRAEMLFEELVEQYPQKVLFKVMRDRIEYFKRKPPEIDWDGAYRYNTK